MALLDFFKQRKSNSASIAKERLQILVAHERAGRNQPSYLPMLQKELIEVIRKYVAVEQDDVSVTLEQEEDREILELNIVLPDVEQERKRAHGAAAADEDAVLRQQEVSLRAEDGGPREVQGALGGGGVQGHLGADQSTVVPAAAQELPAEPPAVDGKATDAGSSPEPARKSIKLPGLLIDFQERCVDVESTICLDEGMLQ